MSGYPAFWLLVAAVVAPLVAEIPIGFKIPVVVLEVLLGIALGPHVLGLLHFNGLVAAMFAFGMAAALFMAGTELDIAAALVGAALLSLILFPTVAGMLLSGKPRSIRVA